ncbi:hypothetical protein EXIGLDRAFT_707576, partial [Exidia glandulosa HHB12029]
VFSPTAGPSTTSPQAEKPLPTVPRTTTVEESTTESSSTTLMVVHDTVDTPVIRSPSYPLPSPSAQREREREPGIPEQDEDEEELLAPTVFVDDVDADADQDEEAEAEEEEEPHHHLHSENDPIQNGVPPGRAAADEPLPPLSTAPGPMHDEPEQDYPLPEEEVHAGPTPPGDMPVHERFACDGCGVSVPPLPYRALRSDFAQMGPIIGIMFMCMHPDCPDYELCSNCIDKGIHPKDHTFIRIEQPSDMEKLQRSNPQSDEDDVVLGLRVYTHRDAPATIAGQLRHGRVVTWSKEK